MHSCRLQMLNWLCLHVMNANNSRPVDNTFLTCFEFSVSKMHSNAAHFGCRAMTSLVAEIPREGGLALAAEIYSPHLDLHQRLLILDTLSAAAQQLSLPPSQAKTLIQQVRSTLILPAARHVWDIALTMS